jgi:predicted permease
VTEGFVLVSLGAVAGLGLAYLVLELVRPLANDFVPRMVEVAVGPRSIGYTAGLVVVTTAMLGLVATSPLRVQRLTEALGATRAGSRPRRRRQRVLVVGEVALAVFVLVASALVIRTLRELLSQPMGFDPDDTLTFRVEPPWTFDADGPIHDVVRQMNLERAQVSDRYDALLSRLAALPGVQRVGGVNRLPLTGGWWMTGIRLPEADQSDEAARIPAYVRPVTPGYLEAMGTRLLRGRGITRDDVAGSPRVVVIDAEFGRRLWGDADPLGREVLLDGPPNAPPPRARVVGVVEAIHMSRLDAELRPTMYVAFRQALEGHYLDWGMDILLRGATPSLGPAVRRVVRETFPEAAVFRETSMASIVSASMADRRFQRLVLGFFAGLALALATIGVGGMLILAVSERRGEIAVRLALGALPSRVWWTVQRDGLRLVAAGSLIGLAAALAGARVFSSVVYGVSPYDPVALISSPIVMLLATFAAAAIPATLAIRVHPIRALREPP